MAASSQAWTVADYGSAAERAAMVRAARALAAYYQAVARPLAAEHGLRYPRGQERVMLARLARLERAGGELG